MGTNPVKAALQRNAQMARRRELQIDNQIRAINRLMTGDRSYDDEMKTLHDELAESHRQNEDLRAELKALRDARG